MKKFILFSFAMLSFACAHAQTNNVQNDLDFILKRTWTDGFDFVNYLPPEVPEMMGIENASRGENLYLFLGGSLHEGGTHFWLTIDNDQMVVANKSEYQLFPVGDKIVLDSDNEMLQFRDASSGKLHGLLRSLPKNEDLKDLMEQNILEFILAGNYTDNDNNKYSFSATEWKSTGFNMANQAFEIGTEYEIPESIIIYDSISYSVRKTDDGIELSPVSENEDLYTLIEGGKTLKLSRVILDEESLYPIVSQRILTANELLQYAGNNPYAKEVDYLDRAVEMEKQIHSLGVMRNEIFARHGYIFSTEKWNDYFGSKTWYNPQYMDVTDQLSKIEKINIEHIRLLENKCREELKELQSYN